MPLLNKKIYHLSPSPKDLNAAEEIFVIPETKECFRSYDEYIAKVFLYSSHNWSCQFTGRSGLTYSTALSSEQEALKQLERFPNCFKESVLKNIHKAVGTLKDVFEKCWKFLTTHYCLQEEVVLLNAKNGKKSPGLIIEVSNSHKEKTNGIEVDKENAPHSVEQQVPVWRYSIQLEGGDVVLTDILTDELKRKTKLPSKELLKLFIRSSSEKISVEGKKLWSVKDELVQKYNLSAVSKSSTKEKKTAMRSPLDTITGRNGVNVPKQKTKKISPKNYKDPNQRTLNFFVQTPKPTTLATPRKDDGGERVKDSSPEKMRGSPVVAELKIRLTPKGKLHEMMHGRSSEKPGVESGQDENNNRNDKVTSRTLFVVDKDDIKADEKADVLKETPLKTQDDEEDFVVSTKEKGKTDQEKTKCNENAETGNQKKLVEETGNQKKLVEETGNQKKLVEEKAENDIKGKEKVHLKKQNDVGKVKKIKEAKHNITKLRKDFSDKERRIVEKNALKKQKTLSQMFKLNPMKKSSKIQDDKENKRNAVVVSSSSRVETACPKSGLEKKLELHALNSGLELVRISLPTPKPVPVPEQLRGHYGDILMITEFLHLYRNFLIQDRDLKCSPDDLMSCLMSDGAGSEFYLRILISFIQILIKDLREQHSSGFSDLGVNLLDITVSEATVAELTKLYIRRSAKLGRLRKSDDDEDVSATSKMTENILLELNNKDIVSLTAVQKLEVLVYLLDEIVKSEVFYTHYQELEESRRQAWVKKIELETEIKELVQEQKKQEETKNAQKEIDIFLEKSTSSSDGVRSVDNAVDNEASDIVSHPEASNGEAKHGDGKNEETSKSCSLTKRQEMAAKSKIEKEKLDEMRRLGEELYQKRQKVERLKEVISQAKECRRGEALGSDRNGSRYWLFQSHPGGLFVEKSTSSDLSDGSDHGAPVDQDLKNGESDSSSLPSEQCWCYYNTTTEVQRLITCLSAHDEKETSLKQKLKTINSSNKLDFQQRGMNAAKNCPDETVTDQPSCLKDELCDLASRITEGDMGHLEDLESWLGNTASQSSLHGLVELVTELGLGVKTIGLSKTLGDREEWLKEDWVPAVKDSMTSSRLRFCVALLDHCITWDACTLYMKCKICRRRAGVMAVCDECRKGFHIGCLRPALHEVPDEEWLCPVCRPETKQNKRRAATKIQELHDEESEEECVNDDYCDVCGGGGELVCCDNCPKVYHKECHDPPLRNIPRGVWKCCACQGRRPTARKRDVVDCDEYSDLESSQDESSHDEDSYSCGSESSSECDSESKSDAECAENDAAAVERAERAKRREEAREEKNKRTSGKKKAAERKGKRGASRDDKNEVAPAKKKSRGNLRKTFNEDSTEEDDGSLGTEKRARSRRSLNDDVQDNRRAEEARSRTTRKRKSSSPLEKFGANKRKLRQNSELKMCEMLLKDLMRHEDSWPFIEPVDISEVPDYLDIVKCPMDFSTIKRKLNTFEYNNNEDFLTDVRLVFSNSEQYNMETSDHGLAGISLKAYFKEILGNYFPKFEDDLVQKESRLRLRKRR